MGMIDQMLAGAADSAASGRAGDLREQDKARIAEARERNLAQFSANLQSQRDAKQNEYDTAKQNTQNTFTSGENSKELASRESIAAGNNATQLQAANISAGAHLAGARGQRRETDKDIVGQPQIEKDENGEPTGMYIVARRDGSMERVNPADLPMRGGGSGMTVKQQKELDKKADEYASGRVSEIGSLFSSDKESFKDYGGSKTAAKEQFKQEYKQKYGASGTPDSAEDTQGPPAGSMASRGQASAMPSQPDQKATGEAATPVLSSQAQYILQAVKKANPNVPDDQLIEAMKANPDYAPYFK